AVVLKRPDFRCANNKCLLPLSPRDRCYSAIPIVSARDLGSELCSQAAKSQLAVQQTETVQSGDWVLSRFQSASDWCRAIVTKLNIESAVCDVFFPDYGNSPGETLVDLLIRVVLHDCDLRFLSVRELLVFANLAPAMLCPYLHNREASNDLVDTEAPRLVSAFYSPDEFYVFRCNQGADMDVFEEMQQALQSFCNEDKIGDYTVQHPVANLPVAARYSVDCNWYRGVIESYSPDGISYRQKQLKDMLQQSHVFNFLCMDTPSTVDPNSDGLPTVPVGVYELNTPVLPKCPDLSVLKREHGEVTVLPRAQPATRGSRVKASARASANSTASDSNVSDSRSSTPAAAPAETAANRMRLRPYWPAFGSLIYCGTAVGCFQRSSTADTCTAKEYNTQPMRIRNHRQSTGLYAASWLCPAACNGAIRRGQPLGLHLDEAAQSPR
uniref:Tudor domain-containing protein n=1 Tax=Macrostomum lignano TaxID=282301 RepID=A0A1I8F6X1_9PLAT